MCEPVTAAWAASTFLTKAFIVGSVASTALGQVGQYQSAKAQVRAINQQNEVQAREISKAAGQEMFERARAARRERGTARAAGSEAGVNLGSGSFLAALQNSAFNQYNDQGLIVQNEKSQQAARSANARSAMSSIQMPTALSSAFALGSSAAGSFYAAEGARASGTP